MQNAYLPGQPWGCATIHRSCRNIRAVLDAAAGRGTRVFLTRFLSDPQAAGVWAEYNRVNREINDSPWLNELIDEIRPYAARYPLRRKSVYSCLKDPEIRRAAESAGRIVLTGVVSECCVLSTCLEAVDLGRPVVWLRDACSGIDESYESAVQKVLSGLVPLHITVMETAAYLGEPPAAV